MIKHNVGIIKVSKDIIESEVGIFEMFNPVHVQIRPHDDIYVVTCLSPLFDYIRDGCEIPEYDIEVTKHLSSAGSYKFTFNAKRLDDPRAD